MIVILAGRDAVSIQQKAVYFELTSVTHAIYPDLQARVSLVPMNNVNAKFGKLSSAVEVRAPYLGV